MAFKIGESVSPTVAAALIRRGEQGPYAAGGRIAHRTVRGGGGGGDPGAQAQLQLELMREERLRRGQDLDEGARRRAEEFAREQWEAQRGAASEAGEAKSQAQARAFDLEKLERAEKLLTQIAAVMQKAGKADPATLKVDPDAKRAAEQVAARLWAQYQALGLPKELEQAALMRLNGGRMPTAPPSRAPGAGAAQGQPAGQSTGVSPETMGFLLEPGRIL